jgi:hypothetical protein
MAPVLARCDREGMRAYLDATSQRNRGLYERHGFAAEEPFAPPGGRRCGRCGASQPRRGSETWPLGGLGAGTVAGVGARGRPIAEG